MTVGQLPPFEPTKLFLSCDSLPLTICYSQNYTVRCLARIAKGSPPACAESHPTISQWLLDASNLVVGGVDNISKARNTLMQTLNQGIQPIRMRTR